MSRVLVDASALIALARAGELELLRDLLGEVHTTRHVLAEVLRPEFPDHEAVLLAQRQGWLFEASFKGDPAGLRAYGLAAGEASLFLAAEPGDALLIDDRGARRLAEVRNIPHAGFVGLLTEAVVAGRLTRERGVLVLDKLARSTFRLSADVYRDALRRMEGLEG